MNRTLALRVSLLSRITVVRSIISLWWWSHSKMVAIKLVPQRIKINVSVRYSSCQRLLLFISIGYCLGKLWLDKIWNRWQPQISLFLFFIFIFIILSFNNYFLDYIEHLPFDFTSIYVWTQECHITIIFITSTITTVTEAANEIAVLRARQIHFCLKLLNLLFSSFSLFFFWIGIDKMNKHLIE